MMTYRCKGCGSNAGLMACGTVMATARVDEKGNFVDWWNLEEQEGKAIFDKPTWCIECGGDDIEERIAGKDYPDEEMVDVVDMDLQLREDEEAAHTFGDKEDSYTDEELNVWHNGGPND